MFVEEAFYLDFKFLMAHFVFILDFTVLAFKYYEVLGKTCDIANSKNECRYYQFFLFKRVATGQQLLGAKPALIWHLQLHSIAPDSACL